MIDLDLSEHARRVLAARGIPLEWVRRVLEAPAVSHEDAVDPELRHALAPIDERHGRVLRVVYTPDRDRWRVVTAFFDRRARRSS